MTEDLIKSVEKCTFQKGDVLIITAARLLCDRERRYIYESTARVLPEDVSVLILDNDMETKVLVGREYHGTVIEDHGPLIHSAQFVNVAKAKPRKWKMVTGCLLSVMIFVAVTVYLLGFGEE